jgi:hypothetical protein
MRTFTDNAAPPRTWLLEITVSAIKRVRRTCSVDLLKVHEGDPPLADRLSADPVLTSEVICALVDPQIRERGISADDFDAALSGRALGQAITMFWEEVTDFFLSLAQGAGQEPPKEETPGPSSTSSPASPELTLQTSASAS